MSTKTRYQYTSGTKHNPVKIYIARAFFVTCPNPKCQEIINCGEDDKQLECPNCKKTFYTDFNLLDCGI